MREPSGKPKGEHAERDSYSPDEAERRAEASLKRLLSTPPDRKRGKARPLAAGRARTHGERPAKTSN